MINLGASALSKDEKERSKYKNALLGAYVFHDLNQARRGAFPAGRQPSHFRNFSLREYGNSLLSEAEASVPAGTTVNATNLQQSINTLRNCLSSGGTDVTSVRRSLTKLDQIEGAIQNGRIEVSRLPAFRRAINEAQIETGHWASTEPPIIRRRISRNLDNVRNIIIQTGEEYGQFNPNFLRNWQEGNEVLSALHSSRRIQNRFNSWASQITSNYGKTLLGLGAPITKATGRVIGSAATPIAVANRAWNSPSIRRLYFQTVTQAAAGNGKAALQSAIKMDKLIKKQEEEDKKRFRNL